MRNVFVSINHNNLAVLTLLLSFYMLIWVSKYELPELLPSGGEAAPAPSMYIQQQEQGSFYDTSAAETNYEKVNDQDLLHNNNNTLTATNPNHCWRHCSQRKNIIFYGFGAAGLGDRMYIIGQLAQIAGYLCARLKLSPPSSMLVRKHNNGSFVSTDLLWQDFRNITFTEDNSSIFVDQHSSSISLDDKEKYSDWLHIVSVNPADTLRDYEKIQDFSWRQDENSTTGFIWEIRGNYYPSALNNNILTEPSLDIQSNSKYSIGMMPNHHVRRTSKNTKAETKKNDGQLASRKHTEIPRCNYLTSFVPYNMVQLGHRITEKVHSSSLQNSTYGFFHIRRGDTVGRCNTTITEIRNFLRCSLNGTERFGKNITILMGSDERDILYRQSVLSLSNNYSHVQILDADNIIIDVLRESIQSGVIDKKFDNNYYVFELLKLFIRPFASFVFTKRKSQCSSCHPLLGKHRLFVNKEEVKHQT